MDDMQRVQQLLEEAVAGDAHADVFRRRRAVWLVRGGALHHFGGIAGLPRGFQKGQSGV